MSACCGGGVEERGLASRESLFLVVVNDNGREGLCGGPSPISSSSKSEPAFEYSSDV